MRFWRQQAKRQPFNHGQAVGIAAAVVVSAYLALLYLPRRAAMQELARQCTQLESIAAAQNSSLKEPELVDTHLQGILDAERALPESDNAAELLTTLTHMTRAAGLRLHQAERRHDTGDRPVSAVVIALTVHGEFAQVMELLAAIENLRRIVEVRSLTLKAGAKEVRDEDDGRLWADGPATVQARMELWAYRWTPHLAAPSNVRHPQIAPIDAGVGTEP